MPRTKEVLKLHEINCWVISIFKWVVVFRTTKLAKCDI